MKVITTFSRLKAVELAVFIDLIILIFAISSHSYYVAGIALFIQVPLQIVLYQQYKVAGKESEYWRTRLASMIIAGILILFLALQNFY